MDEQPKSIGGFFALELDKGNITYHADAIALTSGRSCFNAIIAHLRPAKIYIPYYICDAALIPCQFNDVPYEFYALDEYLRPRDDFNLKENEFILYVNYFGLMDQTIHDLYTRYGERLIIDNTQAFFEKRYKNCWSFNSCRKFFGVPDGGYLYSPIPLSMELKQNNNIKYIHLVDRLLGSQNAYLHFKESENHISPEILAMSLLSEMLLSKIDYDYCAQLRMRHFALYAEAFSHSNQFKISINHNNEVVPYCYPLWLETGMDHKLFHKENIFLPILWQDTIQRQTRGYDFERTLSKQLLPLPIDHRLNINDCFHVMNIINEMRHNTL